VKPALPAAAHQVSPAVWDTLGKVHVEAPNVRVLAARYQRAALQRYAIRAFSVLSRASERRGPLRQSGAVCQSTNRPLLTPGEDYDPFYGCAKLLVAITHRSGSHDFPEKNFPTHKHKKHCYGAGSSANPREQHEEQSGRNNVLQAPD
jgi:hypothetical protein